MAADGPNGTWRRSQNSSRLRIFRPAGGINLKKRILVSFIGKSRAVPGRSQRSGYSAVHYRFPAEGSSPEWTAPPTSLFGAALVKYLERNNQSVDRWIVLGTDQSDWGTLIHALPTDDAGRAEEELASIKRLIEDDAFTQSDLDQWQATIQAELPNLLCSFKIVGDASERASQMNIWNAIVESVEDLDKIVLDVTHSFRHMPVIASFMINALRPIKQVSDVDLYYGGLDLAESGNEAKVIHIGLVRELAKISDAVSTYRDTGNYGQILQQLKLHDSVDAIKVLFSEETNLPAKTAALALRHRVNSFVGDPIENAIVPLLNVPLDWVIEKSNAQRMASKTRFAYEHGQYFKAITLLWESILTAGCESSPESPDSGRHEGREVGEKYLRGNLGSSDRETMRNVKDLRNSVAHGTISDRAVIIKALESQADFERVFERGLSLMTRLLTHIEDAKNTSVHD